jgi:hypothetical protein
MGTRFTPEQFGNAERAGAPRKESSFGDKRAWRDYQERWFKALKPDETLAEEGAERTKAWKAATRQYGQIEAARLRLSSESIEVTANVSVRNRLHVSNHWLRTKAPELTDVQLATPVATPTEQHVVRRLRARVSTEVGPQSCEDAVVYSVPPAAETDGAAERRKDRHRKREEVVLHRLAAGSSAQVAWGETSTDSAGRRAFHPRPFGIAPVAWKADSLSDELKPCTWDFGAGCWRTADGEEYSVEKNARRDAERLTSGVRHVKPSSSRRWGGFLAGHSARGSRVTSQASRCRQTTLGGKYKTLLVTSGRRSTNTKVGSGLKARVGQVHPGRRRNQLINLAGILIIQVGTTATAVDCSDLTSRPTGLCGRRTNMAMTNMAMEFGTNHE